MIGNCDVIFPVFRLLRLNWVDYIETEITEPYGYFIK